MPATLPPDPQLRIFSATRRAVLGPAEQPSPRLSPDEVGIATVRPAPEGMGPSGTTDGRENEEITVEIPPLGDPPSPTAPPAEPALFLLSRGRHRMW